MGHTSEASPPAPRELPRRAPGPRWRARRGRYAKRVARARRARSPARPTRRRARCSRGPRRPRSGRRRGTARAGSRPRRRPARSRRRTGAGAPPVSSAISIARSTPVVAHRDAQDPRLDAVLARARVDPGRDPREVLLVARGRRSARDRGGGQLHVDRAAGRARREVLVGDVAVVLGGADDARSRGRRSAGSPGSRARRSDPAWRTRPRAPGARCAAAMRRTRSGVRRALEVDVQLGLGDHGRAGYRPRERKFLAPATLSAAIIRRRVGAPSARPKGRSHAAQVVYGAGERRHAGLHFCCLGVLATQRVDGVTAGADSFDSRAKAAVTPTAAQRDAVAALLGKAGAGTRVDVGPPLRHAAQPDRQRAGYLTGPRRAPPSTSPAHGSRDNRAAFGIDRRTSRHSRSTATTSCPAPAPTSSTSTQVFGGVAAVARRPAQRRGHQGRQGPVATPATRRARGGLAGTFALTPAQALAKVAGALAPAISFTPDASGTDGRLHDFAQRPVRGSSYVKKVAFPTPRRRAGGVPRALHPGARQGLGRRRRRAAAAPCSRSSRWCSTRPRAPSTRTSPAPRKGGTPVVKSFGPTAESPAGYADPTGIAGLGGPTTLGNNASTYANYSNFLVPADQGPRPVSPTSQFNYTYDMNWQKTNGAAVPPSYALDLNPAATNLFWHHNRIHDEFYGFGFTETAGNFQYRRRRPGARPGARGCRQRRRADVHRARQRLHAHAARRRPGVERHVPVGADQRRVRGAVLRRQLRRVGHRARVRARPVDPLRRRRRGARLAPVRLDG